MSNVSNVDCACAVAAMVRTAYNFELTLESEYVYRNEIDQ